MNPGRPHRKGTSRKALRHHQVAYRKAVAIEIALIASYLDKADKRLCANATACPMGSVTAKSPIAPPARTCSIRAGPLCPVAERPGGGTMLTFHSEFEFRSKLLQSLMAALFEETAGRMVTAFKGRAKQLYGAPQRWSHEL
jgi:hypothetical protein